MSQPAGEARLEHVTLGGLLDTLEEPAPSPAGGSAAAVAASMAAALVALAARTAVDWPDAPGIAAQAVALRERLVMLAAEDARAYGEAMAALASVRGSDTGDDRLGRALNAAADVPLRIAQAAADTAHLALLAAKHAKPALRPDATAAVLLAEAGTRAAAHLVEANLATLPGDPRRLAAESAAHDARTARDAVLAHR